MILHIPAFVNEIIDILKKKNRIEIVVDGTCGTGSHTLAILENFHSQIKYMLCIDVDNEILEVATRRIKEFLQKVDEKAFSVHFIHDSYTNLRHYLKSDKADVIILDLGVSQYHLKSIERGFSFHSPMVDMRYDRTCGISAHEAIKNLSEEELSRILTQYADIKKPARIVKILKEYIKSDKKEISLGDYLQQKLPKVRGKLHPATLIFQALRIYVNKELENLQAFLTIIPEILARGGMVFIITYHSIEDRMVKSYFKKYASSGEFSLYNKKVIKPSYEEISKNKWIRSAKLRLLYRHN